MDAVHGKLLRALPAGFLQQTGDASASTAEIHFPIQTATSLESFSCLDEPLCVASSIWYELSASVEPDQFRLMLHNAFRVAGPTATQDVRHQALAIWWTQEPSNRGPDWAASKSAGRKAALMGLDWKASSSESCMQHVSEEPGLCTWTRNHSCRLGWITYEHTRRSSIHPSPCPSSFCRTQTQVCKTSFSAYDLWVPVSAGLVFRNSHVWILAPRESERERERERERQQKERKREREMVSTPLPSTSSGIIRGTSPIQAGAARAVLGPQTPVQEAPGTLQPSLEASASGPTQEDLAPRPHEPAEGESDPTRAHAAPKPP